jgi:hypothetical protein
MAVESFDGIIVGSRGVHHHDAKQLNRHGIQAAAIADATAATGGDAPTEAEFNALVAKFNELLVACRGVGIIASS